MFVLISYLVINVLISVFFERRKWKIATVAHAAAFTVLLVLVLAAHGGPIVEKSLSTLLSAQGYRMLHEAVLSSDVVALGPIMAVEMALPILMIAASVIATLGVIEKVRAIKKERDEKLSRAKKELFGVRSRRFDGLNRIYLFNCVMRC